MTINMLYSISYEFPKRLNIIMSKQSDSFFALLIEVLIKLLIKCFFRIIEKDSSTRRNYNLKKHPTFCGMYFS